MNRHAFGRESHHCIVSRLRKMIHLFYTVLERLCLECRAQFWSLQYESWVCWSKCGLGLQRWWWDCSIWDSRRCWELELCREKVCRDPIKVCEYLIVWGSEGRESRTHLSGVLWQDKGQQGLIQVKDCHFKAERILMSEHWNRLSGEFVEALSLETGKTGWYFQPNLVTLALSQAFGVAVLQRSLPTSAVWWFFFSERWHEAAIWTITEQ